MQRRDQSVHFVDGGHDADRLFQRGHDVDAIFNDAHYIDDTIQRFNNTECFEKLKKEKKKRKKKEKIRN